MPKNVIEGLALHEVRIAVVGAQRPRVAKVVSLLLADGADDASAKSCRVEDTGREYNVAITHLPCVATFGAYSNGQGDSVRYLASVEYHGPEGKDKGSSLASFFETQDENETERSVPPVFPGVSAIAVGCGIESSEDVAMIRSFAEALSAQCTPVVIECVSPNLEYNTMKEETAAYKALDASEKERVTRLQTLGPGKMAKFATGLATRVIHNLLLPSDRDAASEDSPVVLEPAPLLEIDHRDILKGEPRLIDPAKPQYACRMCRSVLFGENDLEDPPHKPSSHHFSARKVHHGGATSRGCESLFLARELNWMGDTSAVEGKFGCPKCGCKLGSWKWAGAQCSCGSWVTPAIQIPLGKVDRLQAISEGTGASGILSSLATLPSHNTISNG